MRNKAHKYFFTARMIASEARNNGKSTVRDGKITVIFSKGKYTVVAGNKTFTNLYHMPCVNLLENSL